MKPTASSRSAAASAGIAARAPESAKPQRSEIRVLHAADLHVDSPLRGLVPYDGAPVDAVRAATRSALRGLVAAAIDRQVDLVVVAGDLYDGTWRDYNTGLFVISQLADLHEAGIPVVLVYGNHDAESQITTRLRLPPGTTALSARQPATKVFDDLGVAVHGQSYATRDVTDDLAAAYPQALPGLVNIGLLHTCFDGTLGHSRYAPCRMDRLRSKGYDYWALGHVHTYKVVDTDPMVVFPGNLQGRHIGETGPKGAVLTTFVDGEPRIEPLVLDTVRWERCVVDVSEASTLDDCLDRCAQALRTVTSGGHDTYALRVELTGITTLDAALRDRSPWLHAEAAAAAMDLAGAEVWIEKLVVATGSARRAASSDSAGLAGQISSVVADLRRDIAALVDQGEGDLGGLRKLREALRGAGGPELAGVLGPDELAAALDDAAEILAVRMGISESSHAG